jgi:hypothetical protein
MTVGAASRILARAAAISGLLASAAHAQYYPSYAQYLGECRTGGIDELEHSIAKYHEHTDRLASKFVTGFYRQGARKTALRKVTLARVVAGLAALAPRRTALLFYAYAGRRGMKNDRLCIWLISPHLEESGAGNARNVVHVQVPITLQRLEDLRANIVNALGVLAVARDLMPLGTNESITSPAPVDSARAFAEASQLLLPPPILAGMDRAKIDTLLVLPIFDVGAIPFPALPVDGGRPLIERVSVMVAPGFFVFLDPPRTARTAFPDAIVAANPDAWSTSRTRAGPLPGAQLEAQAIAQRFASPRVITADVRVNRVKSLLSSRPAPSLFYLAAHGRADEENPLDGSYLLLQDGPWKAKEIGKLDLGQSRPLIVLSACQTGLGKNFEVGNIGIARAWHQAGASNVVMSLWSTYKPSTRDIMGRFASLLPSCPPDKALRGAMLRARKTYGDPAQWAGFTVYGLPERPAAGSKWNDPATCGATAP